MLLRHCTLLLLCISCVVGQITKKGPCRQYPSLKSFDMEKYVGRWYIQDKYPSGLLQMGGKCYSSFYTMEHMGRDRYQLKLRTEYVSTLTGQKVKIDSKLFVKNSDELSKFKYKMESFPWREDSYQVVATDYTNYAVEYNCENNGPYSREESLWVLSRERKPPVSILRKAYRAIKVLELDGNKLKKVDQSCRRRTAKRRHSQSGFLSWLFGLSKP